MAVPTSAVDIRVFEPASPDDNSLQAFLDGLENDAFFVAKTGSPKAETPHALVARDATGAIVGGLQAATTPGLRSTYVQIIAVREDWRRTRGVGRALLRRCLDCGLESGASVCHLATFSFQGLAYYPKVGFSLDAELPGWAHGISASFFSQPIRAGPRPPPGPTPDFVISSLDESEPESLAELETFLQSTIAEQELGAIGHDDGGFSFSLEAIDPGFGRVGAIACIAFWGGLIITSVGVAASHRRHGLGSRLVSAALSQARDRGCVVALAESLDFGDCPPFWAGAGFSEFGRVRGLAAGAARIQRSLSLRP